MGRVSWIIQMGIKVLIRERQKSESCRGVRLEAEVRMM
jgi:hypothetical protein